MSLKIINDCGEPRFDQPVPWEGSGLSACAHSGRCDADVTWFITHNDVTCDDLLWLTDWVNQYGADITSESAIMYAVWMIAGNLVDQPEQADLYNVTGVPL